MKKLTCMAMGVMLVLFVPEGAQAQMSLVNLVQWEAANGGNDHWYAVLAEDLYWSDAYSVSRTMEQDGEWGYLATITSQAENDFIFEHVTTGLTNPSILDEYFLGGYYDEGWSWITDEEFDWTNWAPGEPNHQIDEPAVTMWGEGTTHPLRVPSMWNDEDAEVFTFWSIVEWGGPTGSVPTTPPGPPYATVVPEPGSLLLFGLGCLAAGGYRTLRKKKRTG